MGRSLSSRADAKLTVQLMAKLKDVNDDFIGSLRLFHGRHGYLTQKQYEAGERFLVNGTARQNIQRATAQIGQMQPIMDLFNKASSLVRRPSIVLNVKGGKIRLNIATERAKVPGSINVIEVDEGKWYGRILMNGTFEASFKNVPPADVVDKLIAFAANPSKVAGEDGRLNGKCCFCMLPLSDERSTIMGYGRTCASNFGLEWGKQKHSFQAS